MRRKNVKGKEKKKIGGKEEIKKEKGRVLETFHHLIHITQPEEAVLSNFFPKRIQLPHRIRSNSTATAGAATAGAGALPNAPLISVRAL
jgi:hypothetical protein